MNTRTLFVTMTAALAFGAAGAFDVEAAAQEQGKGQGKGGGQSAAQQKGQGKAGAQVAQGQSQGKGQGQAQAAPGQAKGRGAETAPGRQAQPAGKGGGVGQTSAPGQVRSEAARQAAPGQQRAGRSFVRQIAMNDVPASMRPMLASGRRSQAIAAGALARAHVRGIDNLRAVPAGDRVTFTNQRGTVLLRLDEDRARDLGAWDVNVFDRPPTAGAPSFCRSGAGHPVWGRQWCVDKGFGLGTFQDVRWGRTTTLGNIAFGNTLQPGRLTTESLLGALGATAFNRLALHAVTLGYTEPLVGTWVRDPAEPHVLLVNSGPAPVAEVIDVNRDGRADLMLVALRPW